MNLFNKFNKSVTSIVNLDRPTRLQTTNVALDIGINVPAVLNSEKLEPVFDKLQDGVVMRNGKKIKLFLDKKIFIKGLIENYKKKYEKEVEEKELLETFKDDKDFAIKIDNYIWERVKFNIKNNILWKNGTPDFNDVVYHSIFIPYELSIDHETGITDIQFGLKIRIIIVNGILKLQVGELNEETSPEILEGRKYLEYLTITSLPLIYSSYFQIPSNYLNLSMGATNDEGYRGKDGGKEWKIIKDDFAKYNKVFNLNEGDFLDEGDLRGGWVGKIMRTFNEKAQIWLKEEEFDDWVSVFKNKYLHVIISDMNEMKDKIARNYTEFGG